MRDFRFSGFNAHPIAVALIFVISVVVFVYACIQSYLALGPQVQGAALVFSDKFALFWAPLMSLESGKGFGYATGVTLLTTLYSVARFKESSIYRWLSYASLLVFGVFLILVLLISLV